MKKVRFGVVGLGGMGVIHAKCIAADRGRDMALGAVCEAVHEKARSVGEELGVRFFTDPQEMYDSGMIDAVLIATPHYFHQPLTIRATRRGIHVLCEKPLSSTVGAAREMIAECRKRKVAFGTMLQQRTEALAARMKQMVDSGRIGEIFRVQMICSANWFRTQAYYDSGAWRGTWDGEGGGVLINQAPHSLDLFQWIGMGLPKRVLAMIATRAHDIEVEDTAHVLCDYGDGKVGYIYASTVEEPGMEQLVICGDKGTLVAEGGSLRWAKLKIPISEHIHVSKVSAAGGGQQKVTWKQVKLPKRAGGGHMDVTRPFAAHILRGTPMVATGEEAINELELSNAAYISGYRNKPVELPVDAAEMDRLLASLEREKSSGKGGNVRKQVAVEMKKLRGKKKS